MPDRSPNPYRGLLFGAIAGATAAWAMNQFQNLLSKATEPRPRRYTSPHSQPAAEDATTRAADRIARRLHFRPLSPQEKAKAGPIIHYAFGTAMGALYGLTTEYFPEARAGFGTIFGTLLFALADETAVPLAGFSGGPSEYPVSSHLRALASHVVYGASAEAVRATLTSAA
jgi:putative membrane protein